MPEASVGVVVSGSSGVREHVQRLGRILRHKEGKRVVLYEIVSKDTANSMLTSEEEGIMLTKDLLKYTTRKGKVFLKYLDVRKTEYLDSAKIIQ